MPDRDAYVDKSAPPKPRAATAVPDEIEDTPTRPVDRESKPDKDRVRRVEKRVDGLELKVTGMDAKLTTTVDLLQDAKVEREARREREIAASAERRAILDMKQQRFVATLPIVVPLILAVGGIITAIVLRAPAPSVAPSPMPSMYAPQPAPIGGPR